MVAFDPAFAVGVFWMVSVLLDDAEVEQGETADAVRVKVIVPAVTSDVLGV